MKVSRFLLLLFTLALAAALIAGCTNRQSAATETEYTVMEITRGDISVEVSATGNLVYADREQLSFETNGTVGEVFVEVGDEVKKDDVLATIDPEEWQDSLDNLERTLTLAKRTPPNKEIDLAQTEMNLQTAQDAINSIKEVKEAQDALTAAQDTLKLHEAMLQNALVSTPADAAANQTITFWRNQVSTDKTKVADAQKALNDVLAGSGTTAANVATQIKSKQFAVDVATKRIEDAKVALEDARKAVDDAQKALNEAKAVSIEIKAPFDGIVTAVSVQKRAAAKKGVNAIVLADKNRFEAEMLVNEIDILKINLGTTVNIEVEALTGVTFPARVTSLAPTAVPQQGVVNYKVKAELSLPAATQAAPAAPAASAEQTQQATRLLNDALAKAVKDGRITQQQSDLLKERWTPLVATMNAEQIDQAITRVQQGQTGAGITGQAPGAALRDRLAQAGNLTPEQQTQLRERFQQGIASNSRSSGLSPESVQLREGLSVTANLVIEQKQSVVLVPNQAITVKGGKNYVLVSAADGTRQERVITVGLADFRNTEVVTGLAAGEKVAIAKTKASSSTTTTPQQGLGLGQGSGIRIPAAR